MSEPVATARLRLIGQLREACRRRAADPWLELHHYIVQLHRAYSDKSSEGVDVSRPLTALRDLAARLGSVDSASTWAAVDELLSTFPWQRNGYAEFTGLDEWLSRHPAADRGRPVRLVEIDPEQPNRLRPYRPNGRRLWLVMGGNRTHINNLEWQDPAILHQPLIRHAETALWRFLTSMGRVLGPLLGDRYSFVGLVPSAVRSPWECRLENFAVTRFPGWSHPRARLLGQDILDEYGPALLSRRNGTVLSAYSLGCAAAEQLMSAAAELAPNIANEAWADSVYFAGYVGLRGDLGPRRRLQVVSLTDEAVFGSPDMPDRLECAVTSRWFSSPLTLRPSPWEEVPTGFDHALARNDSGGGWAAVRVVNERTRLLILAGQTSIPADPEGFAQLDHDARMARTRFGHFLDATLNEFHATGLSRSVLREFCSR